MGTPNSGETWYRDIYHNIPVGIFRTENADRFLSVNPALAAIFGYESPEEMLALPVTDIYWDLADRRDILNRLGKTGSLAEREVRLKKKDGTPFWASLTGRRIVDDRGKIYLDGIVQDISCRKEMERDLAQARRDLQERIQERTADLSKANDRLVEEIEERQRLHEELLTSRKNLARSNVDLEKAILTANQMAADAEVRGYELEMEIERRRGSEAALRESERRYRSIIESIEDGYSELDLRGRFTFSNQAMCRMLGFEWAELSQMKNTDLLPPEERAEVVSVFAEALETGVAVNAHRFNVVRKDGRKLLVEASISLVRDNGGRHAGFRGIVRDVEERRRYEEQLIHQAYHDALTGLKNRKAFYERLRESAAYVGRYGTELALLYIDIDRFKQVNDAMGHETGDALLREIARRLSEITRRTDVVARLGGDEFAVILNNPEGLRAAVVAGRIVHALSRPYAIGTQHIDYVSASIGTARFPDDATDPDTLIKYADTAMYRAKETGNRFVKWGDGEFTPEE